MVSDAVRKEFDSLFYPSEHETKSDFLSQKEVKNPENEKENNILYDIKNAYFPVSKYGLMSVLEEIDNKNITGIRSTLIFGVYVYLMYSHNHKGNYFKYTLKDFETALKLNNRQVMLSLKYLAKLGIITYNPEKSIITLNKKGNPTGFEHSGYSKFSKFIFNKIKNLDKSRIGEYLGLYAYLSSMVNPRTNMLITSFRKLKNYLHTDQTDKIKELANLGLIEIIKRKNDLCICLCLKGVIPDDSLKEKRKKKAVYSQTDLFDSDTVADTSFQSEPADNTDMSALPTEADYHGISADNTPHKHPSKKNILSRNPLKYKKELVSVNTDENGNPVKKTYFADSVDDFTGLPKRITVIEQSFNGKIYKVTSSDYVTWYNNLNPSNFLGIRFQNWLNRSLSNAMQVDLSYYLKDITKKQAIEELKARKFKENEEKEKQKEILKNEYETNLKNIEKALSEKLNETQKADYKAFRDMLNANGELTTSNLIDKALKENDYKVTETALKIKVDLFTITRLNRFLKAENVSLPASIKVFTEEKEADFFNAPNQTSNTATVKAETSNTATIKAETPNQTPGDSYIALKTVLNTHHQYFTAIALDKSIAEGNYELTEKVLKIKLNDVFNERLTNFLKSNGLSLPKSIEIYS